MKCQLSTIISYHITIIIESNELESEFELLTQLFIGATCKLRRCAKVDFAQFHEDGVEECDAAAARLHSPNQGTNVNKSQFPNPISSCPCASFNLDWTSTLVFHFIELKVGCSSTCWFVCLSVCLLVGLLNFCWFLWFLWWWLLLVGIFA